MEICRMDKQPHFMNLGMNSQHMLDPNYSFNEIPSSEPEATSSYVFENDSSRSALIGYQQFHKPDNSENHWKSENVDCKQETNSMSFLHNTRVNENSNYGQENEFNEAYQYAYNQGSPLYTHDANSSTMNATTSRTLIKNDNSAQQRVSGPYQLTSTKNQLPSWYDPPSACFTQQSGALQQQYPSYHHGGFMGGQQLDPDVRNMIQLTSRYFQIINIFLIK